MISEEKKQELIDEFCGNNMQKLNKICNALIKKKNVSKMYDDDLRSVASMTFLECLNTFDETKKIKFKTYLSNSIWRAFYDWSRDQTRQKRCNIQKDKNEEVSIIPDISFDAHEEDGIDFSEKIPANKTVEDIVFSKNGVVSDGRAEKYINNLYGTQKEIARMVLEGYKFNEIKKMLNLSDKDFRNSLKGMREYDKKKFLKRNIDAKTIISDFKEDVGMANDNVKTIVSEKSKDDKYPIEQICRQLRNYELRDNHPLQRHSGQWTSYFKSELISDTLQGKTLTPIIISQEFKDDIEMRWLIDGKQRCTTFDDYISDGFAISKNVQVYMISYQTNKVDDSGNIVLNDCGFPIPERKEFDIRGKKFSKLPRELQEKIKDYRVPVMLNLNCSKKDIAYDIARFNRCRPMNVAQNGWTGLEENFAELVDRIIKNIPMFSAESKCTSYSNVNNRSGALRRMIVESIMVINFIDEFNKDFGKMCNYLSENANDSIFTNFYVTMERLNSIMIDSFANLFNMKDSFIWFAIYQKFCETGEDDKRFIEFLTEFIQSLHSVKVDGSDWDDLLIKATKDRSSVQKRYDYLVNLMFDFLGIENNEYCDNDATEEVEMIEFVRETISEDIKEEDIKEYEEDLDVLTLEVDNNTELLKEQNKPSLIALIAYTYLNEISIDDWFKDFFNRNNTYISNQKENYEYMLKDLNDYIMKASA